MSWFDEFTLRVKRGEGPLYSRLRRFAKALMNPQAPRVPAFIKPFFRMLYEGYFLAIVAGRFAANFLFRQPLFQSRCQSVGKNLVLGGPMPFVAGPVEIHLGESVSFGGKVSILSGGPIPNPKLLIKDRSSIGWNTIISIGKEVLIEEDVMISYDCRISDTDGHPRQADLRAKLQPPKPEDIRAVRICRNAWLGNGAHVMKGVTIGEGAVIAANSVVINDIPPFSLALGNPAEVYFRNFGRPSKKKAESGS